MAVFSLDTIEAIEESNALGIQNNLFSHKDIGINKTFMPYQDNALGLWLMDSKNI